MRAAVAIMAIAAVVWLGYQFWRLLYGSAPIWPTSPVGAVDLKLLHRLVHGWFADRQVYHDLESAVHPPATYILLWPLLGWLDVSPARWLWTLTTLVALGALIQLVLRESGAETALERAFIALIPCSIYATGAAIGNGQLIVHLLPVLLLALLILGRGQRRWWEYVLGSALMLMTLVKPPAALPFLWLALFLPRTSAPFVLVGVGYTLLTFFALSFQDAAPLELLRGWQARSTALGATGGHGNVANLHVWMGSLGLESWMLPASLVVWLALGFWCYHHRDVDLWLLLGVTALVARFWGYHRWYDDVLLLLPMVSLFRIAKRGPAGDDSDVLAGVLLALAWVLMLAPGGLFLFPRPWNTAYVVAQTIAWLVTLVFLLRVARAELRMRGSGQALGGSSRRREGGAFASAAGPSS